MRRQRSFASEREHRRVLLRLRVWRDNYRAVVTTETEVI